MRKFTSIRFLLVALTIVMSVCSVAFAQPGDPGDDPDQVPISGVEWLLLSGSMLGARKLLAKSKRNEP